MKIIILQFMAIIAMILISCNDKENSVYLKNGSYSECATGKNLTKAQEETAYVEISAVNTNTLRVDMYHVQLNCALEKIESSISYNEKVIIIKFTPIGDDANCLCDVCRQPRHGLHAGAVYELRPQSADVFLL